MKLIIKRKGGQGSGHHGHRGIPGQQGGSLPGTGSGGTGESGADKPQYEDWWKKPRAGIDTWMSYTTLEGKRYEHKITKEGTEGDSMRPEYLWETLLDGKVLKSGVTHSLRTAQESARHSVI